MPSPRSNSSMHINSLHPSIRQVVRNAIRHINKDLLTGSAKAFVTSGYRSHEEQAKLYAKGRNAAGQIVNKNDVVTNAKPGSGMHNYGLAFDVGLFTSNISGGFKYEKDDRILFNTSFDDDKVPDFEEVVHYLKQELGFKWGGDWKGFRDNPHFEVGISIKYLQEAYNAGHTFIDNNKKYVSLNYIKDKGYAMKMPVGSDISIEPLLAKL